MNYNTVDHILWPRPDYIRIPCTECGELMDRGTQTYFQGKLVCDYCYQELLWKKLESLIDDAEIVSDEN
jgi:formylmethanofuran dehydrogenase subunit E